MKGINWKRVWLIVMIGYVIGWLGSCTVLGVIYK